MKPITCLLIASAVLFAGCTSSKWVREPVSSEYAFNVTLERQQADGRLLPHNYQHPYTIGHAELAKLLGDLTYLEKAGLMKPGKQAPVFQADEIERLTPALADALAKADAGQRVRFVSFNLGESLVFAVARKTEGVLFVVPGGYLNIAFNLINSPRHPGENSALSPQYAKADPVKIETAEITVTPETGYAELHRFANGKQAPLWVVADLGRLPDAERAAGSALKAPRETPQTPQEAVSTPSQASPAMAAEAAPASPAQSAVPVQVSDQSGEDKFRQEVKERLRYLKELLDEGLISEADYAAKKAQLLDRID